MSIAAELNERLKQALLANAGGWTRSNPVASDLDPSSCLRRQVLEIVKADAKQAPDAALLERFAAGNEVEERIALRLGHIGLPLMQRGSPFVLPRRGGRGKAITGRIDGIVTLGATQVVVEIKLVPQWGFDDLRTAEDLEGVGWWTPKYVRQLLIYLLGLGIPVGMFVVSDGRRTKALEPLILDEHLGRAEESYAFAESICAAVDAHVEGGSLPPFSSEAGECLRCPFYNRACTPELKAAGRTLAVLDEEFARKVARREELEPFRSEFEALDKEIKAVLHDAAPKEWFDLSWQVPQEGKARGKAPSQAVILPDGWYATLTRIYRKAELTPRAAGIGVRTDIRRVGGDQR